ncbi:TAP-like protein-domain-containing protein [Trametes elegans]|nr:TAP-like protein-domain-containing protein [Trametes elegans]
MGFNRVTVLSSVCSVLLLGTRQVAGVLADDYTVGEVHWSTCSGDAVDGAECGYAIVPLDYTDPGAGVAKIALARYNATSSDRKGSVFINPGGPGGPGLEWATAGGPSMQKLLGEGWDIIGFDPRGIGETEPATKCFSSPDARQAFLANTVLDRGYDVAPDAADPGNRYHLIEQQREANALYQAQFALCKKNFGDTARYMGTTLVARDIDYITTLLDGKDALINFYGLSYGTAMGAYIANMFPDRVGHIVLDGVLDVEDWTALPVYKRLRDYTAGTDGTYKEFASECAKAGPSGCALAKQENESADAVLSRVDAFLDGLYSEPLPVPEATLPGILNSGRAKVYLLEALASSSQWSAVASALDQAIAGNGTRMLNTLNSPDLVDLERSAVTCNDIGAMDPPTAEAVVDEVVDVYQKESRLAFAMLTGEPDMGCEYWPFTPPERFTGPWNATLKNPLLIISNTNDPATPLASGKRALERQGKSSAALLIQDGPGHTSLALTSTCTAGAMRAYFTNGTLPAEGTVCAVDEHPFPTAEKANKTVLLAEAPQADEELVQHLRALGDLLLHHRV